MLLVYGWLMSHLRGPHLFRVGQSEIHELLLPRDSAQETCRLGWEF